MKQNLKTIVGIVFLVGIYFLLKTGLEMEDGMLLVVSPLLIILVYFYPQFLGLNALDKLITKLDEDYDGEPIPSKIGYGVPIWTDFKLINLTKRLGMDDVITKTLNILMMVALFISMFAIIYVNALVVFFDFGPEFALLMKNVLLFSMIGHYLLKSVVVFMTMNQFSNIVQSLTAIVHPVAFLYMTYLAPRYENALKEIDEEESLGYQG